MMKVEEHALFTWKAKGERSIFSMEEVDKLMFILKG